MCISFSKSPDSVFKEEKQVLSLEGEGISQLPTPPSSPSPSLLKSSLNVCLTQFSNDQIFTFIFPRLFSLVQRYKDLYWDEESKKEEDSDKETGVLKEKKGEDNPRSSLGKFMTYMEERKNIANNGTKTRKNILKNF